MKHIKLPKLVGLVLRPSLTAFFTAVAKIAVFAMAVKKAVREGLGTRLTILSLEVLCLDQE